MSIDPSYFSAIASALSSDAFASIASSLTSNYLERLLSAKADYREKTKTASNSPVELKRRELLTKLSKLQTELLLYVSDQQFLKRILPLLLEQTLNLYEATAEQELTLTEMNLGQIEGILGQYREKMRARNNARKAAIFVSILALIVLFVLTLLGPAYGLTVNTVIPILALPLPVLLWSTIGSFSAILYRFNSSGDIELQDPLRWLFTRPLTGIIMGTITYFVLKAGLLTVLPDGVNPSLGSNELIWLLAFLTGFSDRFADSLLKSLVGRFGGDKSDGLVSLEASTALPVLPSMSALIENYGALTKQKQVRKNDLDQNAKMSTSEGGKPNLDRDQNHETSKRKLKIEKEIDDIEHGSNGDDESTK